MKEIQLSLNITTKEQIARSWAFAVDTSGRTCKSLRDINHCLITAVSHEAKVLGVRAGMAIAEARLLLPELKVTVCNWSNDSLPPNSWLLSESNRLKFKFRRSTYANVRLPRRTQTLAQLLPQIKAQEFGRKES